MFPSVMLRLHRLLAAALLVLIATSASAAIAIDATASRDLATKSTAMTTPVFSTNSGNELLLAFMSTDYMSGTNTTVTSVTGAGLTWALVVRTNAQNGTSEIWRAFAPSPLTNVSVTATTSQSVVSSITVMSFTGVDTSGANGSGAIGAIGSGNASSGAPVAALMTTRANSWVFGAGTDYDNAISRTTAPGQSIVHQNLPSIGDTYWVQKQNSPTAVVGTTVAINDTAPTTDRYNLSSCEILPVPTTGSISGTISPASGGSGTTVVLNGPTNKSATADSSGNYSFTGLVNGAYTVLATKSGYTFTPPNQSVSVSGSAVTGINFSAQAMTGIISGTISPASLGSGATVTLGGLAVTTIVDDAGNYSFSGVPDATINVTPTKLGYAFAPSHQSVTGERRCGYRRQLHDPGDAQVDRLRHDQPRRSLQRRDCDPERRAGPNHGRDGQLGELQLHQRRGGFLLCDADQEQLHVHACIPERNGERRRRTRNELYRSISGRHHLRHDQPGVRRRWCNRDYRRDNAGDRGQFRSLHVERVERHLRTFRV